MRQKAVRKYPARLAVALLTLLVLAGTVTSLWSEPVDSPGKAIVLPFHVPPGDRYEYLRSGLLNVLATRISTRTGLQTLYSTPHANRIAELLQKGKMEEAFDLLGKSGAAYLFMGSLDKKQDGYLFTVEVAERTGTPRQFTRTTDSLDNALDALDGLSWDIAVEMFGKTRPRVVKDGEKKSVSGGMSGFQTAHPDRAWKRGLYTGLVTGFDSDLLQVKATRRSAKFSFGINDMDAGDLDGDGRKEFVLAGTERVYVFRYHDGTFREAAEIKLASYLRIHALSLADLDNDGRLEIYVSASNKDRPDSAVLEWDGTDGRILSEHIPWYIRILSPEGRPALYGQAPGQRGTGAVIGSRVARLVPGDEGFREEETLALPAGLTIFDVVYADLDGSGERKLIAIDRDNALRVYDRSGSPLWSDAGVYGGSSNYIGTMAVAASGRKRVFIPPRIVVHDFDGDGRSDILVGKNQMKVFKYFSRYRFFEGSAMEAFTWKNDALTSLWKTSVQPEYMVAFQIVSSGNSGDFSLFAAEGQNNYTLGFWQTRATVLLVQEIEVKKSTN